MLKNQSFARTGIFLLVTLLLIHFGFGFLLNFSVDEAHYALYGLHIDWSYFDHPPLVGWIQALPVFLGAPDGVLRLIPQALWLMTIILSSKVSSELISESSIFKTHSDNNAENLQQLAKWFTAIIIMVAPIMHVLAVGLLPDTLLIALIPLMQLLTLKISRAIITKESSEVYLWIGLGLVLGLSGLSKYTSIFSALAIPLCLFLWHGPNLLKRSGLWICLVIAAILIAPIIFWNWQHQWISFIYQLNHGSGNIWQARRLTVFILNQLATYGVLPIIGLWLAIKYKFAFKKILLSFFLIPFIIFFIMSGGGGSLPHWTSPAWVALAPFAGIGLAIGWNKSKRNLIKTTIAIQLGLCAIGFSLLLFGGIPGVSKTDLLGKNNPIADLYGWKEAGQKAKALANENKVEDLVVKNWTLASRIAWYAKPLPVFVLDNRYDQFDIWFGQPKSNSKAIYVNWSQMSYPIPTEKNTYNSCKMLDKLDIYHFGRIISSFDFYLCENWEVQMSPNTNAQ